MCKAGKKFHVWVEVAKVGSNRFKRRQYTVEAENQAEADETALAIAKEVWSKARLPGDRSRVIF